MPEWREPPEQVLFYEANDGRIVFTERGRREMGDLFGRAGISLDRIRTLADYLWARKQAQPFFMAHLEAMLVEQDVQSSTKVAECETEMLRAALCGDEDRAEAAREKRDRLLNLTIVSSNQPDADTE